MISELIGHLGDVFVKSGKEIHPKKSGYPKGQGTKDKNCGADK